MCASGPVKTMCHHRLLLLEQKFNLHVMLNADQEFLAQKTAPHRDFYNIRKVRALCGFGRRVSHRRWARWKKETPNPHAKPVRGTWLQVDTHVHHSASFNQKHLLRFIKSKLRKEPDEVVIYRDGNQPNPLYDTFAST